MFSDISEGCKLLDFHFLGLGSKFSETSKSLFFKRQLSVKPMGGAVGARDELTDYRSRITSRFGTL